MFVITVNGAAISHIGNPSDPSYNPIYLELDSTDSQPAPSPWVKCLLTLPAGYVSLKNPDGVTGGAVVRFEGTTAGEWDLTTDDPTLDETPAIVKELRLDINNNVATNFWARGRTSFGEVPIDDRTVAVKVSGQVKRVA